MSYRSAPFPGPVSGLIDQGEADRQGRRFSISVASPADVADLAGLYRSVDVCASLPDFALDVGSVVVLLSGSCYWMVARSRRTGSVIGACPVLVDQESRLGQVRGHAARPGHRGSGVGSGLVQELSEVAIRCGGEVDSVYATVWLQSGRAPRAFLRQGCQPVGVLPVADRIGDLAAGVVLVRHREGVLKRRKPVLRTPAQAGPLVDRLADTVGVPELIHAVSPPGPRRKTGGIRIRHGAGPRPPAVRRKVRRRLAQSSIPSCESAADRSRRHLGRVPAPQCRRRSQPAQPFAAGCREMWQSANRELSAC